MRRCAEIRQEIAEGPPHLDAQGRAELAGAALRAELVDVQLSVVPVITGAGLGYHVRPPSG